MIKIINGYKYKMEKILCPFVSNTFFVSGGWGPWIAPTSTKHMAIDGVGTGSYWNKLQMGLAGKIVKPSTIPFYKNAEHLDKQGFAIKCDSHEYLHYHHCDRKVPWGTKVNKGQTGVGIVSPDSDGSPNWKGPHCHFSVFINGGKIAIHPFDVMDRSTKLYGQYGGTRQFKDNRDTYIYTNLGKVDQPQKKYYTVKKGGWRSQVIEEIIIAGIWEGTWQQHIGTFNGLNPVTPKGGWRKGQKVRIK